MDKRNVHGLEERTWARGTYMHQRNVHATQERTQTSMLAAVQDIEQLQAVQRILERTCKQYNAHKSLPVAWSEAFSCANESFRRGACFQKGSEIKK